MNIDSLRIAIADSIHSAEFIQTIEKVEGWYSDKFNTLTDIVILLITLVGVIFIVVTIIPQVVEWLRQRSFISDMNKKFEDELDKKLLGADSQVQDMLKQFDKKLENRINESKDELKKLINDSLSLLFLNEFDKFKSPLDLISACKTLFVAIYYNDMGTTQYTKFIINRFKILLEWYDKLDTPELSGIENLIEISSQLQKNKQSYSEEHQAALKKFYEEEESRINKLIQDHEKLQ